MHFSESLATAYRESAARLRALADDTDDERYQRMLTEAAELYDYLAEMADEEGA
jgi:hypothetical protein